MVFNNNLLLGAAGASAGYTIDQSIRFNDNDSAYLTRTPGSASNRKTWTISTWVKYSVDTASGSAIFGSGATSAEDTFAYITSGGAIDWIVRDSSTIRGRIVTNRLFRDPSAWYHLVFVLDTTSGTAGDRMRLWVNGSEETSFSTDTNPPVNTDSAINSTLAQYIGFSRGNGGDNLWDGYQAEIQLVDGTALNASSFGEYNADGVWVPKKYTNAAGYGTNGFYITGATASDLGEDFSGNNNDYTSSGLATTDQMLDTPTNNFWTLNPVDPHSSNITISDGNLRAVMGAATTGSVFAPMLPETGKWAWKITATLNMGSGTEYPVLGIVPANNADLSGPMRAGGTGEGYGADGRFFSASGGSNSAYGATWADGDIIEVGWDADNGALSFWHNGSAQGVAVTGLTGRWKPAQDHYSTAGGDTLSDFGQSGYTPTDASYKTLCTANLDDPTIADPSAHMQTTLYTGTGSSLAVTQSGNSTFQPDWVWIKGRSGATEHVLTDAVRGVTKELSSNDAGAEETVAQGLTAFGSAGFTVGTDGSYNTSSATYVGWQWKANGAGSSNTDGSITSTVAANTTAGFSVVTYTGTGANATVGHGLGAAPDVILVKERTSGSVENWEGFFSAIGPTKTLSLNKTAAAQTSSTRWQDTSPTSSVFSIGTAVAVNDSGGSYVAYCFAEVEGFSKFGSYTGNGSTDGPFIYTGFKPAFVILKRTNTAQEWQLYDNQRDPYNVANHKLEPNSSNAESILTTDNNLDFLSNGFKLRQGNGGMNASGSTYIYMAFAESPFKTATAR